MGFGYPCQFGKTTALGEKGPGGRRAIGKRHQPIGLFVLIKGSSCGPGAVQARKNGPRRGRTGEDVHHILLLPTGLADGLGQEVSLPYRFNKRIRPGRRVPPLLRLGAEGLGVQLKTNLSFLQIAIFRENRACTLQYAIKTYLRKEVNRGNDQDSYPAKKLTDRVEWTMRGFPV